MAPEVGEGADDRRAGRRAGGAVALQAAQEVAVGERDPVVRDVGDQVGADRGGRADADADRIDARREQGVAVGRALAGLAHHRVVQDQRRDVAGGAADLAEHDLPAVDRRDVGGGQRRIQQAQRVELDLGVRARLRLHVGGHGGDVAEAELVDDAVAVTVDTDAGQLHALHADLVVAGAAHEVADEGHRALPLEGADDQVGGDRGQAGDVGRGDRAGAEVDPLAGEHLGGRGHAADQPGAGGGQLPSQRGRHLLGQQLQRAHELQVRRAALDELRQQAVAARIAHRLRVDRARAVGRALAVAVAAGLGVGAGGARRDVVEPLACPAQIGARHAGEPLAVADVGADAVQLVERIAKQLVAAVEGLGEPLERIGDAVQHRLIAVHGHWSGGVLEQREVQRVAGRGDDWRRVTCRDRLRGRTVRRCLPTAGEKATA